MATLTISLSGSAIVTGSKNYTISDADVQSILNWSASAFAAYIQATFNPAGDVAFVPTNQQMLLAWVQNWIVSRTKSAVQQFQTPVPIVPPQITIA